MIPQTYDNDFMVYKSNIYGKFLVSLKHFLKDEIIMDYSINATVLEDRTIWTIEKHKNIHLHHEVAKYLLHDHVNPTLRPNKHESLMIANVEIQKGDILSFDYNLTESEFVNDPKTFYKPVPKNITDLQ